MRRAHHDACVAAATATAVVVAVAALRLGLCHGLGSMSSITASFDGSTTVCGILSGHKQGIRCVQGNHGVDVFPNVSFAAISGGKGVFCGLRQGGLQLLCWSVELQTALSFRPKRISKNVALQEIAVGDTHVCGIKNSTGAPVCWRRSQIPAAAKQLRFSAITAGANFTCGTLHNFTGYCWGLNGTELFRDQDRGQWYLQAAGSGHVCGIRWADGQVLCFGRNESGQSAVPQHRSFEFSSLALGDRHTCALRALKKTVVCWGDTAAISGLPRNESFEIIVAGDNYTCGIQTANYSILCWGGARGFENGTLLSLPPVLPGICTAAPCNCGIYPNSDALCYQGLHVCAPCPPAPAPASAKPPAVIVVEKKRTVWRWQLLIPASAGMVFGVCSVAWCLWRRFGSAGRVHNSVQPQLGHASSLRRQGSRPMRRQRSGPSGSKRGAEEFSRAELEAATDNFSENNRIGAGSFGTVYRGKLADGREVAIKRGNPEAMKKFQEKEAAFQSELGFLSRLHHRNLVSLVGFCDEADERMLVYEFMRNGSLYEHLHSIPVEASLARSWIARMRIALDAARGIEYLHTYAVPPIIHRDIKSSNILLDSTSAARVSDFGLSLMGPEGNGHLSMRAAGTVGYMDPEYYRLQCLTTKSDVYGFGVVLLEILTGRKAIFKASEAASGPVSIVDFAVPMIMSDELHRVLDSRIMPPGPREIEAVELVAYVAVMCVSLEGKDRPSMTDVVANLERAVGICSVVAESVSRNGSGATARSGSGASRSASHNASRNASRSASSGISSEEAAAAA